MEKYIISEETLVLMPLNTKTRVVEKEKEFIVNNNVINIVDESCLFYGSSLKGRCDSTRYLLGIKYKCPILICSSKDLYFFPTTSYYNSDCCWINQNAIKKYFFDQNKVLNVILINNQKLFFKISKNVISNQILKTSRLESILRKIK